MVWGQIAAAVAPTVIGGLLGNDAASNQSGAINAANNASNMAYLDARRFKNDTYSGGQGALDAALATGAYGGPLYASLNPMQTGVLNNQFDFGGNVFGMGQNLANTASGFGGNYADLYSRAMGGSAMQNAIDYATANRGGLVDAALRDSTRQLTEQTLPGINQAAQATGNTNSSRAGVADALAMRGYQDRAADVSSDITNQLIGQSLAQQNQDFSNAMNANAGLANTFGTGVNTAFSGLGNQLSAGGAFQKDTQNQYDANKAQFEQNRDFDLDQYIKYNQGILGTAPTSGSSYQPNYVDPTAATIGGAMTGFGIGNQLYNYFNQPAPTNAYAANPFMDMRPSGQYISAPGYSGFGYMSGR